MSFTTRRACPPVAHVAVGDGRRDGIIPIFISIVVALPSRKTSIFPSRPVLDRHRRGEMIDVVDGRAVDLGMMSPLRSPEPSAVITLSMSATSAPPVPGY